MRGLRKLVITTGQQNITRSCNPKTPSRRTAPAVFFVLWYADCKFAMVLFESTDEAVVIAVAN